MNYGLYTAASGAFTAMSRMDVLSNNLSNVDTVGFRPMNIGVRQREAVRLEDGLGYVDSDALLEKLGAGVMPTATRIGGSEGVVRETGNPLDVALRGEGFLMVRTDDPEQSIGLTRDGRMLMDSTGRLVHATSGASILNLNGGPIQLEVGAPVEVRDDGAIVQNGVEVARLGLMSVPEPGAMRPRGGGVFSPSVLQMDESLPATPRVIARSVEDSAVNPIRTMMAVTTAGSRARSNLRMASTIDSVMGLAISRLGSVTG